MALFELMQSIEKEGVIVPALARPKADGGYELIAGHRRKYIVGQGRLGKQATKTENENYFLLTLAGIAKELQYQGKTQTEYVELYAGVAVHPDGHNGSQNMHVHIVINSVRKYEGRKEKWHIQQKRLRVFDIRCLCIMNLWKSIIIVICFTAKRILIENSFQKK